MAPSALILSTYVCSSAVAASAVTSAVLQLVRRDTGLREPENLMSRCRAPYCVMVDLHSRAGAQRRSTVLAASWRARRASAIGTGSVAADFARDGYPGGHSALPRVNEH